MSNFERITMTRKQEYGYDEFSENDYQFPRCIKVNVHGVVKVFQPKEAK